MPKLLLDASDLKLLPDSVNRTPYGGSMNVPVPFHFHTAGTFTRTVAATTITRSLTPVWKTPAVGGFALTTLLLHLTDTATSSVAPGAVTFGVELDNSRSDRLLYGLFDGWDAETSWPVAWSGANSDKGRILGISAADTTVFSRFGGFPPLPSPTGAQGVQLTNGALVAPFNGFSSADSCNDKDVYLIVQATNATTLTLPYRLDIFGWYFSG